MTKLIIITLLLAFKLSAKPILRIKTIKGDIRINLLKDQAPNTVKRITALAKKNFYDGLVFHRVIPGFVVQGGDPKGNGTGGSGQTIKAEFNKTKHVLGTVAMARSQEINSADSQFYISLGIHPHLDNQYTVFGQVIEGIDIVKKINKGDKMLKVIVE